MCPQISTTSALAAAGCWLPGPHSGLDGLASPESATEYAQRALMVRRLAERLQAEVVETHISWVLLGRGLAYKVRKPVCLPFLDFSTFQQRHHDCIEEIRLNMRLAAELYLGIARITGTFDQPAIDGTGPTLEFAVRMRRFPESALLGRQVRHGTVDPAVVDDLAQRLAAFHAAAPRLLAGGSPGVTAQSLAAFDAIRGLLRPGEARELRARIEHENEQHREWWAARAASGHVRECHGDLHLDNIVQLDGRVLAFDCIEFNASLRWIDVATEMAFPFMDFCRHDRADLAWRLLNGWMEATGDYDVLPGLRDAAIYRALVRAMVEDLRNPRGDAATAYARTALALARPHPPVLCITHGLPGSGKTRASLRWLQAHGAVRVRADVERKRLFGLAPLADSRQAGLDIYTEEATRDTYARLFQLAQGALAAGHSVVLDATFLDAALRRQARELAARQLADFRILACWAPPAVLESRLRARGLDASEADVHLLRQLRGRQQELAPDERRLLDPASVSFPADGRRGDERQAGSART